MKEQEIENLKSGDKIYYLFRNEITAEVLIGKIIEKEKVYYCLSSIDEDGEIEREAYNYTKESLLDDRYFIDIEKAKKVAENFDKIRLQKIKELYNIEKEFLKKRKEFVNLVGTDDKYITKERLLHSQRQYEQDKFFLERSKESGIPSYIIDQMHNNYVDESVKEYKKERAQQLKEANILDEIEIEWQQ